MVTQGQNHIDSPANMLQQQHSYEVSEKNISILSLLAVGRRVWGLLPNFKIVGIL